MCTIIVLHRVASDFPLVVAANRDEFYERAASGPELLAERPRVVGGRDLERGGSWLGATETGLFVALTNQRTHAPPDRRLRSRGEVVVEALRCGSAASVRQHLDRLDARQYNPFNLIYGDARQIEVAYGRPSSAELERDQLAPGVIVLANDRLGSPDFPKTVRAAALVRAVSAARWPELLEKLGRVLGDHELPDPAALPPPPADSTLSPDLLRQLQALCIHTPAYGTRSSTVLAIEPGRVAHFAFAPGPPCTTPFEDVTQLLSAAPS